jgi:hypothetical protein
MQMQNEEAAQEDMSAAYQMFREFSLSRTCSVESSTAAKPNAFINVNGVFAALCDLVSTKR